MDWYCFPLAELFKHRPYLPTNLQYRFSQKAPSSPPSGCRAKDCHACTWSARFLAGSALHAWLPIMAYTARYRYIQRADRSAAFYWASHALVVQKIALTR
jgi:hypothetical protein